MMRARKPLRYSGLLLWCCACGQGTTTPSALDAGPSAADVRAAMPAIPATPTKGSSSPSTNAPASRFPGSGTGTAGAALRGGNVCDAVIKTRHQHLVTPATRCMKAKGSDYLAATLEQVLECVDGTDTIHLRLTFDPGFVDNTFGAGSIGWPRKRGHTFVKDLTKSDHAEITVRSSSGAPTLQFKLDYVSELASAPSGFGSLGVKGGDGAMLVGDAAWIVQWDTSISRNLNERGYGRYTVDSPVTDSNYTPNPQAPEWDYRVVYEAWIDVAAFGGAAFGGADISFVHASPAKAENDTLEVEPGDCPPPFCQPDDPKCAGTGGVGGSSSDCGPDDPDCTGTGGVGGRPSDCAPDDPECFKTGGVAGAPEKPPAPTCPPDQPGCSPE